MYTSSILYDRLIGEKRRRNHHQAGASSPMERSPVREGERDFENVLKQMVLPENIWPI
jgi:hypothetical protein